jgi:cytochrome c biogenesis protein CcdA
VRLRDVLVRAVGPILLVVAGVALGEAVDSSAATGISSFLIGLGGVLALAIVFWEVGRSEDRDRARQEAEARRSRPR